MKAAVYHETGGPDVLRVEDPAAEIAAAVGDGERRERGARGEMGQVGPDHDRPALVKFAELDFLFAPGRFQEDQLRSAPRSVAPHFLQPENVAIKRNRLLQVADAIAGVQKFFDHRYSIAPNDA